MASDESSDEEMPLSQLASSQGRRKKRQISYEEESEEEEAEFESEEEDHDGGEESGDIVEEEDDDGDSDSDDDALISSLKSPKKKLKSKSSTKSSSSKKATKATSTKKTTTKKKKPTATKKAASKTKRTDSSTSDASSYDSLSAALYQSESKKGKLIAECLRRWWYAMTWPDKSSFPPSIPENCDTFDGFPGVYVHTSGEDVGKILDFRDESTCPNFKNFVRKSSEELKVLLLKSITEQKRVLQEHEGKGTVVEKELDKLHKWASKVNVKTADKEAEKILKAAGLKI